MADEPRDAVANPQPVWEFYKALTEQCEHFNELESTYRTLASTWLLATFAGIGFILKELPESYGSLYVAAVSCAGAVGVFLLWLLDLQVYHSLLAAVFAERLRLENQHAWLPQVANRMMQAHGGTGVLPKVVWFYIAPFEILALIALIALGLGISPQLGPGALILSIGAGLVLLGVIARRMWRATVGVGRGEVEAYQSRLSPHAG